MLTHYMMQHVVSQAVRISEINACMLEYWDAGMLERSGNHALAWMECWGRAGYMIPSSKGGVCGVC